MAQPRGLVIRQSRWTLPARTPAYPVHLPELPHGLALTSISFAPDLVCVSSTLPEWRMDVPRKRLEDIINQLSVVGVPLNLTRLGRLLECAGNTHSDENRRNSSQTVLSVP